MTRKYFGTDGIRGRVCNTLITPDFMLKLGWAAGMAFRKMGACKVFVGKDTRISGYMFEPALEVGLHSAGADVMLLGPMPTPAIAYLTRTFHAEAGIAGSVLRIILTMTTASSSSPEGAPSCRMKSS